MFGIFKKNKQKDLDKELQSFVMQILQIQYGFASRALAEEGKSLDLSPDPFVVGYVAGIVDGAFQRANLGPERERILAASKAIYIEIFGKEGGEAVFNLSINGIVNEDKDFLGPYTLAIDDHNKHQQSNLDFPYSLGRHLISKSK